MKMPAELTSIIEKMVNDEVERRVELRIKSYPIYVRIDGQIIDHGETFECGQIDIDIETPIFFPKSDMEFVLVPALKGLAK